MFVGVQDSSATSSQQCRHSPSHTPRAQPDLILVWSISTKQQTYAPCNCVSIISRNIKCEQEAASAGYLSESSEHLVTDVRGRCTMGPVEPRVK